MKKYRVWFVGASPRIEKVKQCLKAQNIDILGCLDNDDKKNGTWISNMQVYKLSKEILGEFDYIIIAVSVFEDVRQQLSLIGVPLCKIINFCCRYDEVSELYSDIICNDKWKQAIMIHTFNERMEHIELFLGNLEFEIANKVINGNYIFPQINSAESALDRITEEGVSLCRFGDGEFEIILGRNRPAFQRTDKKLGQTLRQILISTDENVIICIADNYGALDKYTDDAAKEIRKYMNKATRIEHINLIKKDKEYYDTYVSRPYIIYRDKSESEMLFRKWKRIWNGRNIILIEGKYTRTGYRNNLLNGSLSVKRIICPDNNAWAYYEKIWNSVLENATKFDLILIALGPTATVLVYNLAQLGYQAIDIGQLDNEFEWYLRGVETRVNISYKGVSEYIGGGCAEEETDKFFQSQIVNEIF